MQYYLSNLLEKSNDNLYLCLLTHLSPYTFRNYIFPEKRVNNIYLIDTVPKASDRMKAFISFREGLDKTNSNQKILYNKLSHDLFHYNPIKVDYSSEIQSFKPMSIVPYSWGKTDELHKYLLTELNNYLSENGTYDPYAVAMALRLRVEKKVYNLLDTTDQAAFIDEHKTVNKFSFAEKQGVLIPSGLYITNAIHNDADHLKYDPKKDSYNEKSLVYKLQNKIILGIIRNIFDWKVGATLLADCIE